MTVAIVGSRTFNDKALFYEKCDYYLQNIQHGLIIVSGGASGADSLAFQYAMDHKINFILMKADWNKYGKPAGIIRNEEMAKISEVALAFWDGSSRGTAHMINTMKSQGKSVKIVRYAK